MRRTALIGMLLGGLLLAACHGSSSSGQPSSPAGQESSGSAAGGGGDPGGGAIAAANPQATLTVADPAGHRGPFAIGELDRLLVSVDCSDLKPGPHAVRVAVTSPDGSLYAQLPTTVVARDDGAGRASSTLRVRGSTIESYRQVGSWQLVASVDGVPLAIASVELTD